MIKWLLALVFTLFIAPTLALSTPSCLTKRHHFFDKKYAQAWSTTICPNSKLAFHTHKTARVLISKENGILEVLYKNGTKQTIKLTKNIPTYLPVSEGIELHQDINIGSSPLHLIVISIKNT